MTAGSWPASFEGWAFGADGRLYAPEGWAFTPGDIRAGRIREQQVRALEDEIRTRDAAPSRYRVLCALEALQGVADEVTRLRAALAPFTGAVPSASARASAPEPAPEPWRPPRPRPAPSPTATISGDADIPLS